MTTITAKIVADSISPAGKRLTTMELRAPRFILAEINTHRALSRNARSSRAVPVSKMIEEAMTDPVIPIHWGAAQKGMQAYEECNNYFSCPVVAEPVLYEDLARMGRKIFGKSILSREDAWLMARDRAVEVAQAFHVAGYAKQVINRLLEPFLHVDILVTATEWDNFFELRDHHMAEPHIEALAKAMKVAMAESTPQYTYPFQWHTPYVEWQERQHLWEKRGFSVTSATDVGAFHNLVLKLSVARCARISYAPFDGDASIEAELKRYDLLVGSRPLHASPCEHQATPDTYIDDRAMVKQWRHPERHRNFVGWNQNRFYVEEAAQ